MRATRTIARRAIADSRTRNTSFALLFAIAAAVQVVGYRTTYPTQADRIAFARTFGDSSAIRLFYGVPHDLLTVGGYAAWRVGGILSLFAAVWGVLAAVRALRSEEDTGRLEIILAAPVTRRRALAASLVAIAGGAGLLWLAAFAGLAGTRLPVGDSAFLALALTSPVLPFAGAGAVASQLAPSRRLAMGLGFAAVAIAFALRVVADTASDAGWLRWVTPLGWVEQMRAFAGPEPLVLLLPVLSGLVLLGLAVVLSAHRDVGSGFLRVSDSGEPRLHLLSSPLRQTLRGELAGLAAWTAGIGGFALITGIIAKSFSSGLSDSLRRQLGRFGGDKLVTPAGALSFYFVFFALVISLFASAQIVAARREESEQRLETLFALPVGRARWLAGRLVLAAGGALALALVAGALAWAGAASQHAGVPLLRMLEAGANTLPAVLLFLGLAALAFAVVPRASSLLGYGLIVAALLWELVGGALDAPRWTLQLSPFHHLALIPVQAFRPLSAAVMLIGGAVAAAVAIWAFGHRDLTGA